VKYDGYLNPAAAFVFNEMGTDVSLHCARPYYRPEEAASGRGLQASLPTADLWKRCLSATIMPIIDRVREALGGLDGVVLQSTLWDVALPFEADKAAPLFAGGPAHQQARQQFMQGWERNMSTFLDYVVPRLRGINGEGEPEPWLAWRTINYVHNKTGNHYFNKYGQILLEDMKQVALKQAALHGIDTVPYHLFPGSHLRRDDVHPNVRSSAALVEYTIRALGNMQDRQLGSNAARLVPDSAVLGLIEESYRVVNAKADVRFATLTEKQKQRQRAAWARDEHWHLSNVSAWERDIVEARRDPAKEQAVYSAKIHLVRDGGFVAPKTLKPKDILMN